MRAQRGAGFGIVSYIVMGVVIVLILVGGLLLVSSMSSSSPSGSASIGATPTGTREGPLTCPDSLWLDEATQTCVARAECLGDQVYDEATNTCGVAALTGGRIDGIAPSSGLSTGGTEVRVTGTGFEPGADVLIDGIEATARRRRRATPSSRRSRRAARTCIRSTSRSPTRTPSRSCSTTPSCTSPQRSSGSRRSTRRPAPQKGGEAVIIKGVDFVEGVVVSFFGRPATDVVVLDSSTLRVTTPAGPVGPVNVNVRNPGEQTYTDKNGFRYVDRAPRAVTAVQAGEGSRGRRHRRSPSRAAASPTARP